MNGDHFDESLEGTPETQPIGDQTVPAPGFGTGLADPAVDDVADTLIPLIERAALASDSLRATLATARPTEASLRATLGQITESLDRADRILPTLERHSMSTCEASTSEELTGTDAVRAMIDTAVQNLGTRCQMQLDLVRTEIDELSKEIGGRLDALAARVEEIASRADAAPPPPAPALPPALEESLGMWETQVSELLKLFREKAEQAMTNVGEVGRHQTEALDALCARAERLLSAPGRDAGTIVQVLDEVVNTIEPWRGLLIEGKCGPEIAPAVAAIVDRVRSEIQGDIGRIGETVSQVVAMTSRLAETTPGAVTVAPAREPAKAALAPKAKPARTVATVRAVPAPTKGRPTAAKAKGGK